MMQLRPTRERGRANYGWLDTRHTFSFANYHDPRYMGFRHLRVLNDDRVAPGAGFPPHPHRDMEIVSYVVEGALEHRDSMGHGSVIRAGDVQRMSAGSGVLHSEYNASQDDPLRFLQIWILPNERGLEPGYEQIHVSDEERKGKLRLIASPTGQDGSVVIHQDARLYTSMLSAGDELLHTIAPDRHVWLQVIDGRLNANGIDIKAGDGLAMSQESQVILGVPRDSDKARSKTAHILLFDLA
jgi:redox-sensitive bicupin YhaK (pirin superfamily)